MHSWSCVLEAMQLPSMAVPELHARSTISPALEADNKAGLCILHDALVLRCSAEASHPHTTMLHDKVCSDCQAQKASQQLPVQHVCCEAEYFRCPCRRQMAIALQNAQTMRPALWAWTWYDCDCDCDCDLTDHSCKDMHACIAAALTLCLRTINPAMPCHVSPQPPCAVQAITPPEGSSTASLATAAYTSMSTSSFQVQPRSHSFAMPYQSGPGLRS